MDETILKVEKLKVGFRNGKNILTAVEDISFEVKKGKVLCIVGESGCGKSVTATSIMKLQSKKVMVIQDGAIYYKDKDLTKCSEKEMDEIRGNKISMIFQEPMTSLNPVYTIGHQLMEIMLAHPENGIKNKTDAKKYAIEMLGKVGILSPETRVNEYPHQLSGGMRQRVMIAMALCCNPDILIADEPTTALDVTIQAQILKLLKDLKAKYKLTTLYITHDLGVVANVADRIAVMYAGDIVEIGTCEEVFYTPKHPYTWALLSSLPQLGVRGENLYSIPGTPPNLFADVKGDAFAPRNPYALKIDFVERPPYFEVSPTHKARTWLLDPRAPKVEPPENIRNLRSVQEGNV